MSGGGFVGVAVGVDGQIYKIARALIPDETKGKNESKNCSI